MLSRLTPRFDCRFVKVFNILGDEWDHTRNREGWRSKFAGVGRRVGAEQIGATVSETEPGERLWPYHAQHSNEEWLVVLRGQPTLRTRGRADARGRRRGLFPSRQGAEHHESGMMFSFEVEEAA